MEGLGAINNAGSLYASVSGELFPVVIINMVLRVVFQLRDMYSPMMLPVLVDMSFHRNRVGSLQKF